MGLCYEKYAQDKPEVSKVLCSQWNYLFTLNHASALKLQEESTPPPSSTETDGIDLQLDPFQCFSGWNWYLQKLKAVSTPFFLIFCSCGKYANWIKQAQTVANPLLQDILFNTHLSHENDSVCVRKEKPRRKVIILCLQFSLLICDSHFSVKGKSILL